MSKQKWIKKIVVAVSLTLILVCTLGMTGCGDNQPKDGGDFYYRIIHNTNDTNETPFIRLCGLTELGKTKKIISIPREISGVPIKQITYFDDGIGRRGLWESNNLEKVFLPDATVTVRAFSKCTKLDKIILYDYNNEIDGWGGDRAGRYICSYLYSLDNYTSNIYDNSKSKILYFANVSYMYNYDTTKNNGYYWIDDYDYGSKIEYIPVAPSREGYKFDGWYKESECINKWDFETDTLPEEIIEDNLVKYQETKLYAKWETA